MIPESEVDVLFGSKTEHIYSDKKDKISWGKKATKRKKLSQKNRNNDTEKEFLG